MTKKTTRDTYFVQIGLKRGGRIVKNEQYSVSKFIDEFVDTDLALADLQGYSPSIWDVLVNRSVMKQDMVALIQHNVTRNIQRITKRTNSLIKEAVNADNFGKKK